MPSHRYSVTRRVRSTASFFQKLRLVDQRNHRHGSIYGSLNWQAVRSARVHCAYRFPDGTPLALTVTSTPLGQAGTMVLLVVIVVILVICGLAASVASRKGRSGVGYFALSTLCPPVGLVAALVAKPNEAEVEKKRLESGTERRCPFCAEVVKREAVVCRFCSRDLPALKPIAEEIAEEQAAIRAEHERRWASWREANEREEKEAEETKARDAARRATPEYKRRQRIVGLCVVAGSLLGLLLALTAAEVFNPPFIPNLRPIKKADLAAKAAEAARAAAEVKSRAAAAAQKAAQRTADTVRRAKLKAELESLEKQWKGFSKEFKSDNYRNIDAFVAVVDRELVVGAEMGQIVQTYATEQTPEALAAWNRAWRDLKSNLDEILTEVGKAKREITATHQVTHDAVAGKITIHN